MAPHWKCGSRQRVEGSNPSLSATHPIRARPRVADLGVIALPLGEFTFRADDPWPGQTGVVVAYAVRHSSGVFLFDTGFGFGNAELDDAYTVRARDVVAELERAGIDRV